MKPEQIRKALMKKLKALEKLNEAVFVSVRMRSPVLNPHSVYGVWYPVVDVPVEEVEARLREEYTFVFRTPKEEKKDGTNPDDQSKRR